MKDRTVDQSKKESHRQKASEKGSKDQIDPWESDENYEDFHEKSMEIVRDFSERKKREKHYLVARQMEAIATLSGGIAHQFNNALSGITLTLDFLELDWPDDDKMSGYVKQMRSSVDRMTRIVDQLLAYGGEGKYQTRTVVLSRFVRDTIPMISHTIPSFVFIEKDLDHDTWRVEVDLSQFQMVLSAILNNSTEAITGQGRIKITCMNQIVSEGKSGLKPGLRPGRYATVTIQDDGEGMNEETRSRVFEPFFTTKFHGRGLEMAAAHGIIKNHDGWISIDSELGRGTIVTVYLPAV